MDTNFPPVGRLLGKNGETRGEAARASSAELRRRQFLATSAAVVGGLVRAVPATAIGQEAPARLPSAPTKENAQTLLVGPLIPVITNLKWLHHPSGDGLARARVEDLAVMPVGTV